MVFRKFLLLTAAVLFAVQVAYATDEWLAADQLHGEPGAKLTLHLNAGDQLVATAERTYALKENERFELYFGKDFLNLVEGTQEGTKPFWSREPDFEGQFLVLLTRAKQDAERQRVWRFAKLLGRIGPDEEGSLHHRFMGQQLEMVLIQNPVLLKPGDEEIVQLYFETKPLAGQTINAWHREGDNLVAASGVTDARGVVRLRLVNGGVWLLTSEYLRACKGCKDADTERFHATYLFELGS
jgi:uncharacterized GH25 family protein